MKPMLLSASAVHIITKDMKFGIKTGLGSKCLYWDFPGGAVVKNPPANAGDTGSSPGPGRSHMPWNN